jgi:fructosamine-3-kinase
MIPEILKTSILESIETKTGKRQVLKSMRFVGGGSINNTLQLKTDSGNYFIKWNDAKRFPEMFAKEARGLKTLAEANEIQTPEIVLYYDAGIYSYLILNFIEAGKQKDSFWQDFGRSLAKLHRHSDKNFGLDHNNYIGSLHQSNKKHYEWIPFFIEERMEAQIRLAKNSHIVDSSLIKYFDKLFRVLPEIFPIEKSSLLHGDLWSGNYLTSENGLACIIDPAVYYGFREMDIAISKLFGGFNSEFYSAYNEEFAMEKGWEQRVDICNLYPLLVHVNLFGGGYIESVKNIVKRY